MRYITAAVDPAEVPELKIDLKYIKPWDDLKARREIGRVFSLLAEYGPTDHLTEVVADWLFDGDRPYVLSYEPQAPTFRCSVVLNSRMKEYFAVWPRRMAFTRMMWFMQAYFGSLVAKEQFEAGDHAVMSSSMASPDGTLSDFVSMFRTTYSVSKDVDRVLRDRFQAEDGDPLSLAVLYQESSSWPVAQFVMDDIAVLAPAFASEISAVHRRHRIELDAWRSCAGYVGGLLERLALLAAAYDETSDWQWRQARLYDVPAFARFIAPAWPAIHADWRASRLRDYTTRKATIPEAKETLRSVFRALGVTILDEPRGTSVLEFQLPDELESMAQSSGSGARAISNE